MKRKSAFWRSRPSAVRGKTLIADAVPCIAVSRRGKGIVTSNGKGCLQFVFVPEVARTIRTLKKPPRRARGKAPARIARIFDVLIQAFPTPETPKRSCGAPQHRGHSKYPPYRESLNIRHQLLVTGHWSLVIANGLFAISAIVVFCPVYWASSKLWERRDGSEKGWGITFVARWPVSVTGQLISARRFFY